jgi:predicted flap endonuclease-1-like 5' DNA nuclease
MKKIGILFGQERSFPQAFVDRINAKQIEGISAEFVNIERVLQGEATDYAVIVDRISQDVPFYRAYLKNAAATGTAVINNPFWWSADEKFLNNVIAMQVGVPVPETALLPSHHRPDETTAESFTNMALPYGWDGLFEKIGFPAYMKPHSGGGWKSVYKVHDAQELFKSHAETEQLVMMLQENIDFESYFRCYCVGQKHVHIMPYEPRNPHHLRYLEKTVADYDPALIATIEDYVLRLNKALGYDLNTVEFAVRDGVPIAIDFCNPAPDADINSVGEHNFEWILETMANYAIERAQHAKEGQMNLSWGSFVRDAVMTNAPAPAKKPKTPTKKAPAKKKAAPAKAKKKGKETKAETLARIATKAANIDFGRIGTASSSDKDDLKEIKGIGPFLEEKLNSLGIFTFAQIAKFNKKDEELVNDAIEFFPGRIRRDEWVKQAKKLK